jgi:hypothetical protein
MHHADPRRGLFLGIGEPRWVDHGQENIGVGLRCETQLTLHRFWRFNPEPLHLIRLLAFRGNPLLVVG